MEQIDESDDDVSSSEDGEALYDDFQTLIDETSHQYTLSIRASCTPRSGFPTVTIDAGQFEFLLLRADLGSRFLDLEQTISGLRLRETNAIALLYDSEKKFYPAESKTIGKSMSERAQEHNISLNEEKSRVRHDLNVISCQEVFKTQVEALQNRRKLREEQSQQKREKKLQEKLRKKADEMLRIERDMKRLKERQGVGKKQKLSSTTQSDMNFLAPQ